MKKLLITVSTLAFMSTSAMAQDNFDTLFFNTELYVDNFRLSLNTVENANPELAVGYYVWDFENDTTVQSLMLELGHTMRTDQYRVTAEYSIAVPVNDTFAVYAQPSLNLVTNDTFSNTDAVFIPVVGVSAYFSENVVGYTELTTSFNLSNSFSQGDTIMEVGADVMLSDNLSLTPSITYNFDAPSNARFQGGLTLAAQF